MKHGEERNRYIKRDFSNMDIKTASGKEMSIGYCSQELSVAEKWCGWCNEWVSTEELGLLGFVYCPKCGTGWKKT